MTGAERIDRATRFVPAAAKDIYRAFIDPDQLIRWLPPAGMAGRVHAFEPREGGRYRIELTYLGAGRGKSGARSDMTEGRFMALVPDREIVWSVIFQSDDEAFQGEMTMRWTFRPEDGGTRVDIACSDVPPGISAEDHAAGMGSTLDNLAGFMAAR